MLLFCTILWFTTEVIRKIENTQIPSFGLLVATGLMEVGGIVVAVVVVVVVVEVTVLVDVGVLVVLVVMVEVVVEDFLMAFVP